MSCDKRADERRKGAAGAPSGDKRRRLAEGLRSNLTKRKALARARTAHSRERQEASDEPADA